MRVITFQPTCPLVTVCILLLDLVITLAKSHLVLVISVEDTPTQACSLSQQPSLRAFSQHSFMTSFLYQSQPICTLVGSENPFLTAPLKVKSLYSPSLSIKLSGQALPCPSPNSRSLICSMGMTPRNPRPSS